MVWWVVACRGPETEQDTAAPAGERPTNVLVVLLDDVGTDKLASYGEHPIPAQVPTLDALAAEGVIFRNAWASATCSPARGALLTGRYGRRYGLGQADEATVGIYELPANELTLPEMLRLAPDPWATSLVGKWHLASYKSEHNLLHPGVQGFDWYHANASNVNETAQLDKGTYYDWELVDNGELVERHDVYVTSHQIDDAIDRVRTMPEPWFLYLSTTAAHTPLGVPPESLASPTTGMPTGYDLGVRYHLTLEAADRELGRLLAEVDLEDTLVIVTSDNGTPSHAILPPLDPDQGKLTLFEGGINVPLIVAGPQVTTPGSESAALVHLVDIFATAAEVAGVDPGSLTREDGSPAELDGESLLPYVRDPDAPGRDVLYAEEFGPNGLTGEYNVNARVVRGPRYKLLVSGGGVEAMYDLEGRPDDGPNLLTGALDPEQEAEHQRLAAALDELEARVALEY